MLYHLMVKPYNSKATGDKKIGYSNTLKINNTSYLSHKYKLQIMTSKILYNSIDFLKTISDLKSDYTRLKKYLINRKSKDS